MKYKIDGKLIKIIQKNRKILSDKKFNHQYKNWLYVNKSINKSHLEDLCNFLKININELNLKEFQFNYEKNFGNISRTYRSSAKRVKFNGIDKRFAEFVGILLGDGSLDKNQNQMSIVIDVREEQYIKFINDLFYQIFKDKLKQYKFNKKNSVKLYFYSKKLLDILVKYGLKRGNKIKNKVGIPSWIKQEGAYIKSCIRGLMDTDGCVIFHKRDNSVYLNFSNSSKNLSSDFINCSRKLGFNFVYFGKRKKNVGLFRKKEVEKYVQDIGFSNEKHLKRYYNFINTINKGS